MRYNIQIQHEEDGSPILAIWPAGPRENTCRRFVVHLNEVSKFSSEHNPYFKPFMAKVVLFLHDLWDLGIVTSQKLAEIAMAIEDGIEMLIEAPPLPDEYLRGKVIGEGRLVINQGEQVHHFEVTDNGIR